MTKGKAEQLSVLAQILPEGAAVREMLDWWQEFDERYWAGRLRPCWLSAGIVSYGRGIGTFCPCSRTILLASGLWSGSLELRRSVLLHEMIHQAQFEFYGELNAAKGPRGQWTDSSHRCPSWSRAVEDWIQMEQLPVFCPVWQRSSGNAWYPWVPDSADWLSWRRVEPDSTFDGRRLLTFEESRQCPTTGFSGEVVELFGWEEGAYSV